MILPCLAPLFLFKPAATEGVPTNWNERPRPPFGCRKLRSEEEAKPMGVANYDIVPVGKLWGVQHDGKVNGKYSTKESAFESAAAAASMAIHEGHEVHISVPSGEESGAASKAF